MKYLSYIILNNIYIYIYRMNIDLGGNIKKISEGINELKPEHKPFIKKGVLNNLNQIQFYVPEDVERDEYLKKNTYFNLNALLV